MHLNGKLTLLKPTYYVAISQWSTSFLVINFKNITCFRLFFPCLLHLELCQNTHFMTNFLPNFVWPTLTVSDLSQKAKFGKVRSYEVNLPFGNFAFVSFHPMIVHPISVHPMIQKSCQVKRKTCLVLNFLNWKFFSFSH